jgi:hypothetical protein
MERMLGWLKDKSDAEQLLKLYIEFAKLDGKPEKGERKIADDFILIYDELLQEIVDEEPRDQASISQVDIMRIGVLEYALN